MPKSKENSKNNSKGGSHKSRDNHKEPKGSRFSMSSKSNTGKSKNKKSRVHDDIQDDYQFRKSLESDGLSIADMAADGNCLFRALSDQLYGDYGNCHEEIRSDICDYMAVNQDDFKVFLVLDDDSCEEGDDGKDFESYIDKMRQDGEWGGNLELVAAARLYQRRVTVFSASLSAYSIEPGDEKPNGPDILVSFHDNDHYNSVRDEKCPPKPPPKHNSHKGVLSRRRQTRDQASDTTTATSTTTVCTESDMSVEVKLSTEVENLSLTKPIKKSAPCPCGSGQRYKKCCHAKEKLASRLEKFQKCPTEEDTKVNQEVIMKGNFRVLQI